MAHGSFESRFRIAVLSPLPPRKGYATTGVPPLRAFTADGGSIDSLFAQIPIGLKLQVPDPLGKTGDVIRVDLEIRDMRGFRPDAIAEQVVPLRALNSARTLLQDLARKGGDRAAAVAELTRVLPFPAWAEALAPSPQGPSEPSAAPTQPRATAKENAIDALLGQVAVPSPAEETKAHAPKPSGLSSLIAQVARGGAPGRAGSSAVAIDRATRAFGALLSDILDHPEVRRLERVWRSARYLLGIAKAPVEVEFLPLDDENLADALLYLLERPSEVVAAPDLIVLDTEIPLQERALAALEVPAQAAMRLRAPLIVGTRAEELLETDEATQALREAGKADWASWVVIACNGALLRGPYTTETSRLKGVRFEQEPSAAGARCVLSPPCLLAALAARAFLHDGWASSILGPEAGTLGEFDVHGVMVGGETSAFATERLVTIEAAKKHARRGLLAFTSVPNRDMVVCVVAPTLAATAMRGAPSFSDQLFVSRMAAMVAELGASIPAGTDATAAEEVVTIALSEVFPRHGAVPTFGARVRDEILEVTIEPRRFACTTMGELVFEAPLTG